MIERLAEEYKDCVFSGGSEEDCLKKMSHSKEAQEITELKNEIEELQKLVAGERQDFLEAVSDGFKAAKILHEALTLKPNAGGKIKEKIREALQFIDDI